LPGWNNLATKFQFVKAFLRIYENKWTGTVSRSGPRT
jgi:hypothetical protein